MESEAGGWRVRQGGGWRVRQKGVESDIGGGRRVGQRGYEELGSWQRGDGEVRVKGKIINSKLQK